MPFDTGTIDAGTSAVLGVPPGDVTTGAGGGVDARDGLVAGVDVDAGALTSAVLDVGPAMDSRVYPICHAPAGAHRRASRECHRFDTKRAQGSSRSQTCTPSNAARAR